MTEEIEFNHIDFILDHDNKVVKIKHKDGYIPLEFTNLNEKDKTSITTDGDFLVIPWKLFEKVENVSDITFKEDNGIQIDPCTNEPFKKEDNGEYIVPETTPILHVKKVTFLPISYLKKHKSKFMKYVKGVGFGVGVVGLVALNIIPGVGEVADVAAIGALGTETTVATAAVVETTAATAAVVETTAVTAETATVASSTSVAVATEGVESKSLLKKGYTHISQIGDHVKNIVSKAQNHLNSGILIIQDTHKKVLDTTDKIQDHIDKANAKINETTTAFAGVHNAVKGIGSTVINGVNTAKDTMNYAIAPIKGSGIHDREKIISNYKIVIVLLIILIIIVIYMIYIAYKHKSADGSIFSVI